MSGQTTNDQAPGGARVADNDQDRLPPDMVTSQPSGRPSKKS
jgi:hypothetical protein